ncbi:MAG: chorismate mutase [Blastocatellia bacterium]|nr:chorismate mutase [Blastocatellia bacterium]
MTLQYWRDQIDQVDEELVRLLNRRAQYVQEIAKLKHRQGLPVHFPDREAQVFARICAANPGPLDGEALIRLFHSIIAESRRLEHDLINRHTSSEVF